MYTNRANTKHKMSCVILIIMLDEWDVVRYKDGMKIDSKKNHHIASVCVDGTERQREKWKSNKLVLVFLVFMFLVPETSMYT